MRFQKLKMAVAASLMIFFLVVGIVIAIGMLASSQASVQNVLVPTIVDPKLVSAQPAPLSSMQAVPADNVTVSSPTVPDQTAPAQSVVDQPVVPSPPVYVYHPTRRTRAS